MLGLRPLGNTAICRETQAKLIPLGWIPASSKKNKLDLDGFLSVPTKVAYTADNVLF